jgi:hypothetical protein
LENSLLSFTRIVLSSTQVQYEEDDLDAYNDPFGLARELIKTKIIGREKAIAELERNCSAMFGTIWGQLSDSSIQVITQHHLYEEEELDANRDDPLTLWKIITATHVAVGIGREAYDAKNTRKNYAKLEQGPTESLVRFKDRFDNAIEALTVRGLHIPDQDEQAMDFIDKLDPTRYYELQVSVANTIAPELLPNSLAEAYRRASTYVISVPRFKPQNDGVQAVFMTTAGKPNTRNRDKGQQNSTTKKSAKNSHAKAKSTGCYVCNSTEHWSAKCPHIQTCRKAHKSTRKSQKRRYSCYSTKNTCATGHASR